MVLCSGEQCERWSVFSDLHELLFFLCAKPMSQYGNVEIDF